LDRLGTWLQGAWPGFCLSAAPSRLATLLPISNTLPRRPSCATFAVLSIS